MKDRVSKYPNRVKLKPVSGQPDTFDLVRADEPIETGTPLNKETLLNDVTANQLGFTVSDNPTVSDAFGKVNQNIQNAQTTFQKLMTGRFV